MVKKIVVFVTLVLFATGSAFLSIAQQPGDYASNLRRWGAPGRIPITSNPDGVAMVMDLRLGSTPSSLPTSVSTWDTPGD